MGKKRKNEDLDEEKILRKIQKLEEKLKKKYDGERSEIELPSTFDYNEDVIEEQNHDEQDSIYLPPSEWAGDTDTPLMAPISPQGMAHTPEPLPTGSLSPQPGPSSAPTAPASIVDKDLDESILSILGDAPKPVLNFGSNIHKDVATRWQDILAKGLSRETKEKIVSEYLIPANCELLLPPILNPEAKAALSEALVRRDYSLLSKQKHIAAALAALAQVTDMIISNEYSTEKLLKPISDASRLLCDGHHLETKTRRSFVISSINNSLKSALIDTTRDKYLFGENLTEKLKAAKNIQRSGDTLKSQYKAQLNRNNFNARNHNSTNKVNSKALHPRTAGRLDAGLNRPVYRAQAARMPPPSLPPRRQRSPLPPAPPPLPHPPARRAQYTRR